MSRYSGLTVSTESAAATTVAQPTAPVEQKQDDSEMANKQIDELTKESSVDAGDSSQSPEALSTRVDAEIKVVEEGFTEVENQIKKSDALINVSNEAHAIVADKGYLTQVENHFLNVALANIGPEMLEAMPSVENYDGSRATELSQTEVSLEGIVDNISTAINNTILAVQKTIKNGFGVLGALTPVLDRLRKRAVAIKEGIDNSNREDGLKEIPFKGMGNLVVDGKAPEATTIIKTLKVSEELAKQCLDAGIDKAFLKFAQDTVDLLAQGSRTANEDPDDMALMNDGIQIPFDQYPSIFNLIPAGATQTASGVHGWTDDNFEFKSSVPLFGDRRAVTYQHRKNRKNDNVTVEYAPGLEYEVMLGAKERPSTIQVLTSKEQVEVIDSVITLIDTVLAFWKSYKSRNDAVQKYFQGVHQTYRNIKTSDRVAATSFAKGVKWLSKAYKHTLWGAQYGTAIYVRDVAMGLTELVEKSSKATQANVAGKDD